MDWNGRMGGIWGEPERYGLHRWLPHRQRRCSVLGFRHWTSGLDGLQHLQRCGDNAGLRSERQHWRCHPHLRRRDQHHVALARPVRHLCDAAARHDSSGLIVLRRRTGKQRGPDPRIRQQRRNVDGPQHVGWVGNLDELLPVLQRTTSRRSLPRIVCASLPSNERFGHLL